MPESLIKENGNNQDVVNAIVEVCKSNTGREYVQEIAKKIPQPGSSLLSKCWFTYRILQDYFVFDSNSDTEGTQVIRTPDKILELRKTGFGGTGGTVDSKSYAILASAILKHFGVTHSLRFVSLYEHKPYHHVYVIVPTPALPFIIDPCMLTFGIECKYVKSVDYTI